MSMKGMVHDVSGTVILVSKRIEMGVKTGGQYKCTGEPTAHALARYRCSLPGLAGLAGLSRVGPGTPAIITLCEGCRDVRRE
jgi:hypothetical protein